MIGLLGGALLGWGLGANDAANCFGTAVSARMIPWRRAAGVAAIFIVLGAWFGGAAGLHTLQGLGADESADVGLAAGSAALTVVLMTLLRLPVSTSQAVVGALVGSAYATGTFRADGLLKVLICWVGTPLGAMLVAAVFMLIGRWWVLQFKPSIFSQDRKLRIVLYLAGAYGALALGANNVANVARFLVGARGMSSEMAVLLGGTCIAIGVLTFSRGVMLKVGRGITPLDGLSASVVVLAQAVTVHVYAQIGVPVSSSQAVVGAVLGIGLVKGMQIIKGRVLLQVGAGWLLTPVLAALLAFGGTRLFAVVF